MSVTPAGSASPSRLQRGRRSESTEIASASRRGWRRARASKGPSIRVDGDTRRIPQSGARPIRLQRGRRSESTEIDIQADGRVVPSWLQRGRRSESTEMIVGLRCEQHECCRFKGAVDQSRRRSNADPRLVRMDRRASKGPSIRVDGDRRRRQRGRDHCRASKGPSIRVDGDGRGYRGGYVFIVASKGPSIRVDGDS